METNSGCGGGRFGGNWDHVVDDDAGEPSRADLSNLEMDCRANAAIDESPKKPGTVPTRPPFRGFFICRVSCERLSRKQRG